jgi:hypothetical protein
MKIRIRDEHPGSYFREVGNNIRVKILIFFDADVDPDTESGNIFDPGFWMEKIRIRDHHPGSATLVTTLKLPTSCPSAGSSWRGAPLRQWP